MCGRRGEAGRNTSAYASKQPRTHTHTHTDSVCSMNLTHLHTCTLTQDLECFQSRGVREKIEGNQGCIAGGEPGGHWRRDGCISGPREPLMGDTHTFQSGNMHSAQPGIMNVSTVNILAIWLLFPPSFPLPFSLSFSHSQPLPHYSDICIRPLHTGTDMTMTPLWEGTHKLSVSFTHTHSHSHTHTHTHTHSLPWLALSAWIMLLLIGFCGA